MADDLLGDAAAAETYTRLASIAGTFAPAAIAWAPALNKISSICERAHLHQSNI